MGDYDDQAATSIEGVIKTVETFENTEKDDMVNVIQTFNDSQSRRYEQYRRSHFDRTCIKRVLAFRFNNSFLVLMIRDRL